MSNDKYVELLKQSRESLDEYLFADVEPSYDAVLELCRRIDALLSQGPGPGLSGATELPAGIHKSHADR